MTERKRALDEDVELSEDQLAAGETLSDEEEEDIDPDDFPDGDDDDDDDDDDEIIL